MRRLDNTFPRAQSLKSHRLDTRFFSFQNKSSQFSGQPDLFSWRTSNNSSATVFCNATSVTEDGGVVGGGGGFNYHRQSQWHNQPVEDPLHQPHIPLPPRNNYWSLSYSWSLLIMPGHPAEWRDLSVRISLVNAFPHTMAYMYAQEAIQPHVCMCAYVNMCFSTVRQM